MRYKYIKRIVEIFEESDICELEVKTWRYKIVIRKNSENVKQDKVEKLEETLRQGFSRLDLK